MNGVKQQVIRMIEALPEDITVEDIMAELYFMEQVDAGLKELDEGKWIPHEEVEKRISKRCKGYNLDMETINKDDILFYISKETLQYEAMEKIGRSLTEEELDIAKKGLEWGLMTDIETVYNAILFEMIK